MRKTPQKLLLRSQTIRVLANLDLSLAMGGGDSVEARCTAVADTSPGTCPVTGATGATANNR